MTSTDSIWDNPVVTSPDFLTHLGYVRAIAEMTKGLELACSVNITKEISRDSNLDKKKMLIEMTLESLRWERDRIMSKPEYAELCISWIPIKSYYVIYNLELILEYLLQGTKGAFAISHKKMIQVFSDDLHTNRLIFSKGWMNFVVPLEVVLSLQFRPGAQLVANPDIEERFLQSMKKIANYKLDDFKRSRNFKDFRTKKSKQEKLIFLRNETLTPTEFFYWYRIKVNYRDIQFLHGRRSVNECKDFYNAYLSITSNYCVALATLVNKLAMVRIGAPVFATSVSL